MGFKVSRVSTMNIVLHIWNVLRVHLQSSCHEKKKFFSNYVVMDVKEIYCDHFKIYTNMASLCCIFEPNIYVIPQQQKDCGWRGGRREGQRDATRGGDTRWILPWNPHKGTQAANTSILAQRDPQQTCDLQKWDSKCKLYWGLFAVIC